MIFLILLLIIILLLLFLIYNTYKFKIKLFIKSFLSQPINVLNEIKFENSNYVYFADNDIIEGIEVFKTNLNNKIKDATKTILNVVISEYPILLYLHSKNKTSNFDDFNKIIEYIDTLTGTNYAILHQMPNKLKFYISHPYISNNLNKNENKNIGTTSNNDLKYEYFRYKKFKNYINFFPSSNLNEYKFTDFINYVYISSNSIYDFINDFKIILKKESHELDYRSRSIIFKIVNPSFSETIKALCFGAISKEKYSHYEEVKDYIPIFKNYIENSKSLIIVLNYNDDIIYISKTIPENNECRKLPISPQSLEEDNFKMVIYNEYRNTKNKKILYILIVITQLINQLKTKEYNERIENALLKIDKNIVNNKYYSTEIEDYLYKLFLYYKDANNLELINLFKIVIPRFEMTTGLNAIDYFETYDLRDKDILLSIKILSLLKYAKDPKSKTIILPDYSKMTAFMKVKNKKLIKEDIDYEDFIELKNLVFICYKNGVNIKIANICDNSFFKKYFINKQYLKLNELDHNIFPIDYNHFDKDLKIYKNLNTIIEFVNLKSKYTNSNFLSSIYNITLHNNTVNYDSFFNDVIIAVYSRLRETKNYISDVRKIKYIEFNIRNPLTIDFSSIWKYPKLLNNTMLFDLTGKFSIAFKFLYSIFVDSSSLSKEIEKCKELFYELGIEMNIVNFDESK